MDIITARKRKSWTQATLAEKIGMSPGHVADIERGHRRLTLSVAAKVEAATGVTGLVKAVVAEQTREAVS